ncbi:unnamed protein product [Lasius platythorax]|uniref:Salivary secreted peptide n=1 Tax=Lasius platythorax TaxID=488582 RepID=A0AAV2N4Z5_9HYME
MSAQKYIIDLAFLIAVLLAIAPTNGAVDYIDHHANPNKSQNLSIGYRVPGDRLVLNQSVVQHNSHPKVIVIEKSFNIKANERLTLVQSLNQHTDGNGPSVSLVRGGPGHNTVTLLFESQIGHGINHVVELYAR